MSESRKLKEHLIDFFQRLDKWVAGPHPLVIDIGRYRQARLLAYLSIVYALTNIAGLFASTSASGFHLTSYALIGLFAITIISYIFSRTRSFIIGAILLIAAQSIGGIIFLANNTSGTFTGILSSIIPSLLIASAYLPVGWVILLTVIDTVAIVLLPLINSQMPQNFAVEWTGSLATIGLLIIVTMVFRNRVEQERLQELRTSNLELEDSKSKLEERVSERTAELAYRTKELEAINVTTQRRARQFEAIAQVTRSTSNTQNLQDVLSRITDAISTQFGVYHVGVFLIDETSQYAVLTAANSKGGQNMLARVHRLEVGKVGIVGYVAGSGEARIALDTGEDAVYFDNPDLPQTHSEIALPLKSGRETIGVLDVQSTESSAFEVDDIETLGVLADQVSLVITNTRLFEQTQRALAESEMLNRQYLRQEWEQLPKEQKLAGFRYNVTGSAPLEKPLEIPDVHSVFKRGEIVQKPGRKGQAAQLAVPVQIRGETIGILNIQSPKVNEWQPEQIEIVKAVAERVGLSAENARLFEETSRRAERERTVSRITTSIRSTNDPQTMLQTALEELKLAIGATDISIRPYAPPSSSQPVGDNKPRKEETLKKTAK